MKTSYPKHKINVKPDRRLPVDLESEVGTVGSMLLRPATAADVFAIVQPNMFVDQQCRAAIEVIHAAWQAGHPIDPALVLAAMRDRGGHIADGAAYFLAQTGEKVPTAAHAKHYAQRVREAAKRRRMLDLADRLTTASQDREPTAPVVDRLLEEASEMVDSDQGSADPFDLLERSLTEGERQQHFDHAPINSQLARIQIGPGLLTGIGGQPGVGKTALALQMAINAMYLNESLRVLIPNCEMEPLVQLQRSAARIARVPFGVVRNGNYAGERRTRMEKAVKQLVSIRDRLTFMGPPFTMPRVRALAASTRADLVVIDYLQRFECGDDAADQRMQVSRAMSAARELAMSGPGVLLVLALSRVGQFRESSEIEYGLDQAWVLERDGESRNADGTVPLKAKCMKNRHGAIADVELNFDGVYQEHLAPHEVEPFDEFADWGGEPDE